MVQCVVTIISYGNVMVRVTCKNSTGRN